METVLGNRDLCELIIRKLDTKGICNFRQTSKNNKRFSHTLFIRELVKYKRYKRKQKTAQNELYTYIYEDELEFLYETLDPPEDFIEFDKFHKEVFDNILLYNILILNSKSEDEFQSKIVQIHKDFLDEYLVVY